MNSTDQPRTVFEQRRSQLRRRNHLFNVFIGHGGAALATRRITHSHDRQRVRIRQAKQRVPGLAATDLHFAFDESGIFEALNRKLF